MSKREVDADDVFCHHGRVIACNECAKEERTARVTAEPARGAVDTTIAIYRDVISAAAAAVLALLDATQAAEAGRASGGEWVACSEQMPEPSDETILMLSVSTEVLTGAWDGEDWLRGDRIIPRRHITHWAHMPPLPPPPEKPTEGGGQQC